MIARLRSILIVAATGLILNLALSQDKSAEKYVIAAHRVPNNSILLDGMLDEEGWQKADSCTRLIQCEPVFNVPCTENTTVKILYDDENIYVGVICYYQDMRDLVARQLAHRDNADDDQVYFVLDTFHSKTTGYSFGTNALGSKDEIFIDGPDRYDDDWNEVWEVKTQINPDNWCAEFRIPTRILRFPDADEQQWGFNIYRSLRKKNERAYFVPVRPEYNITYLTLAGTITGIQGLAKRRNLQLRPYLLLGGTEESRIGKRTKQSELGLDLKYVPLPNLALDVTYNTDFAQIESDDQQINLSRFSLFYPEKRDFFLENAQLFQFGMAQKIQPFFSRRIGIFDGQPVPILLGGRVTGKLRGSNIGALSISTKSTSYQSSTNYSVLRFRQDILENSNVGFIFTNLQQKEMSERSLGFDTELWPLKDTRVQAWCSSLDLPAVRMDNSAYHLGVNYNTDLHQALLSHTVVGKKYDPAMGFVILKDFRDISGIARKSFRFQQSWLRKLNFSGIFDYIYTQDGRVFSKQNIVQFSAESETGDELGLEFINTFEELNEDFPIFSNIRVPKGAYTYNTLELQLQANARRDLSGSLTYQQGTLYGGNQKSIALNGLLKFNKHVSVGAGIECNDVHLPHDDFNTAILRLRWNFIFTSELSLRTYFQYSSANRRVTSNLRFHYLFGDDSDFYIVFNNLSALDSHQMIGEMNTAAIKINYRLYI
jgi:hypothetical protein